MDPASFTAGLVTTGPLDGVDAHVGWAADADGGGAHLVLMRGAGDDRCCVVAGDGDTYATRYGGVLCAEVRDDSTTLTLEPAAAAELGLPEQVRIDHGSAAVDVTALRQHLEQVLGG